MPQSSPTPARPTTEPPRFHTLGVSAGDSAESRSAVPAKRSAASTTTSKAKSKRDPVPASPADVIVGDRIGLLGIKADAIDRMAVAGLAIPPGFVLTAAAHQDVRLHGGTLPRALASGVREHLKDLERATGRRLGDDKRPLLVSVRCSPAVRHPGLLKAVLNVGLNAAAERGLMHIGSKRFAAECRTWFAKDLSRALDLPPGSIPDDPVRQIIAAIEAAMASTDSRSARAHRLRNETSADASIAVIVQAMVYGNFDDRSGVLRGFTRDPETGVDRIRLASESRAQQIAPEAADEPFTPADAGELGDELADAKQTLERCFADMQEFECTVQSGRLWFLKSRTPSRTTPAALAVAVDLAGRKIITPEAAVLRVDPSGVERMLHRRFDPTRRQDVLAIGVGASPGAAVGSPAFSAAEAIERAQRGESVLLVCVETEPQDIHGMRSAAGVLTGSGGMTSHAAVVARGWGKCCVVGVSEMRIDPARRTLSLAGRTFGPDDTLSIDGTTGHVLAGEAAVLPPTMSDDLEKLLVWADAARTMKVLANADTPEDARIARKLGAEGIGLCRTEHMFFDPQRVVHLRAMVLAAPADSEGRQKSLARLLPFQRRDFDGLFRAMDGLPVTIRLLDPPLHEFLPHGESQQQQLADALQLPVESVRVRVLALSETNPMLGHRGTRLAITFPEILQMQVRAIIEAACDCVADGVTVLPRIMLPLIGTRAELNHCRALITAAADEAMRRRLVTVKYRVGTMIETPRAAVTADELAVSADFFSFGTNDLTQLTFGYSRDDSERFLPDYLAKGILERDPFTHIDDRGVGRLVRLAVDLARGVRSDLPCGICGEHGGDPSSIAFCQDVGLDSVSCSPYRVPIARLAAAQAAIASRTK